MIDSYLYTVGKHLPPKGKEEILEEIKSNLYDYLEENYGKKDYSLEEEIAAIKALGHPKRLAQAYNTSSAYLIGPGYIDLYFLVLKIALTVTFVGISIASIFQDFHSPLDILTKLVARFWQSGLSIVGMVTLIFISVHHFDPKNEAPIDEDWSLDILEDPPKKYESLSRGELITESIFIFLALFLINQNFDWIKSTGSIQVIVPTFNMDVLNPFLWIATGLLAVNLMMNLYLALINKWQKITCILSIGLNVSIIILLWWLFMTPNIIDYTAFKAQLSPENSENIIKAFKLSLQLTLFVITGINLYDSYKHINRLLKLSK